MPTTILISDGQKERIYLAFLFIRSWRSNLESLAAGSDTGKRCVQKETSSRKRIVALGRVRAGSLGGNAGSRAPSGGRRPRVRYVRPLRLGIGSIGQHTGHEYGRTNRFLLRARADRNRQTDEGAQSIFAQVAASSVLSQAQCEPVPNSASVVKPSARYAV